MFHVFSHVFGGGDRKTDGCQVIGPVFGPHTFSYYIPILNLMVVGSGVYASGFNHVIDWFQPCETMLFSHLLGDFFQVTATESVKILEASQLTPRHPIRWSASKKSHNSVPLGQKLGQNHKICIDHVYILHVIILNRSIKGVSVFELNRIATVKMSSCWVHSTAGRPNSPSSFGPFSQIGHP